MSLKDINDIQGHGNAVKKRNFIFSTLLRFVRIVTTVTIN